MGRAGVTRQPDRPVPLSTGRSSCRARFSSRSGARWCCASVVCRSRTWPGFSSPDLLTVGEASARLGLFDILRGQPRLRSIEGSDIGLWLERAADGRGNWESARQRDPAAPQAEIDVGQIMLNRVAVHYHDVRSETRRWVGVDELSASAARNDRLRLSLRGRMEKQVPFSVTLDGGPLQIIQRGSEPWPFTLALDASGARLRAGGVLDLRLGEARFPL